MIYSSSGAVTKAQSAVVVIILVIAAAAGVYAYTSSGKPTSTSTSTVPTSSTSSTTAQSTSSVVTTSTVASTSSTPQTTSVSSSVTNTSSTVLSTNSSASTSSAGGEVQTLSIDTGSWPGTDVNELPAVLTTTYPDWLYYTVYQPLVTTDAVAEFNQGTFTVVPGLAANWTVSTNGTIYTFNLRNNVHFSNGDPFNAYQLWGWLYGEYSLTGNSSGWHLGYPVFDMSPVRFGPSTISLLSQSNDSLIHPSQAALNLMMNSSWPMYVASQYQFVFRLNSTFSYFPTTLIDYESVIADAQYVLNHGGFGNASGYNTNFNLNPIPGTGPYTVTGVAEQNYVQFAQDPNYWAKNLTSAQLGPAATLFDPGHAKTVIMYYKADDLARYTDLSSGSVQISDIGLADFNLAASQPQYTYLTVPSWSGEIMAVGLNTQEYPTNITAVRQAILHSINYSDVAKKAYIEMTPFVGPEYPAWKQYYDLGNVTNYQYNLTLAKQYLVSANISAASLPTLTFPVLGGCSACTTAAEIIQADIGQLGINVNVVVSPNYYALQGSYSYNLQNAQSLGQINLINGGANFAPDSLNPGDTWGLLVGCSSVFDNEVISCNPTTQNCINDFLTTSNTTQIVSDCTKAQAYIYNQALYGWIGIAKLYLPTGGSPFWRTGVVSHFYTDPAFTAMDYEPLFNTVTFG